MVMVRVILGGGLETHCGLAVLGGGPIRVIFFVYIFSIRYDMYVSTYIFVGKDRNNKW